MRPDLLIIDEMGYLPLEGDAATILFQVSLYLLYQEYKNNHIYYTHNLDNSFYFIFICMPLIHLMIL